MLAATKGGGKGKATELFMNNVQHLKRTVLYNVHQHLNAKLIPFSGYLLPKHYGDDTIIASCLHTRTQSSLFDNSYKRQLRLYGKHRATFLERLTVGDIKSMEPMDAKLTLFTNQNGGIIDDCIVTAQEDYLQLIVNASNETCDDIEIVMEEKMKEWKELDVIVENQENRSLLSLQGPLSMKVLQPLVSSSQIDILALLFMKGVQMTIAGIDNCLVTRCGYTGEDGFEISVENKDAESLALTLLNNPLVKPAGLGARDVLRLEAGMCDPGIDYNRTTTPVEASLVWTIGKRRKSEAGFPGDDIILKQLINGVTRKRVGFSMQGGVAKELSSIYETNTASNDSESIGYITSSAFSPTLQVPIGMGMIQCQYTKAGTKLSIKNHSTYQPAEIVKLPFCATSYYLGPEE